MFSQSATDLSACLSRIDSYLKPNRELTNGKLLKIVKCKMITTSEGGLAG